MAVSITDPIDWKRDPTTGDVVVPLTHVVGLEAARQLIDQSIRLVRGEWFLDRTAGVPYVENEFVNAREALLAQPFDAARWRAEMRRAILGVATVLRIDALEVTFDGATRVATVTWKVTTIWSQAIAGTTETITP